MSLQSIEDGIKQRVDELRLELGRYQAAEPSDKRIKAFIENNLDCLIYDIGDLRRGLRLPFNEPIRDIDEDW